MAVESRTVGQLVERVTHGVLNTATQDAAMSVEIKWALDYAMRWMVLDSDHPAFRTDASMWITKGVCEYDLPDDYIRMIDPGVKHASTPFETLELLHQQYADEKNFDYFYADQEGRPCFYMLRGRNKEWETGAFILRYLPIPDDTYQIKFSYFASPVGIFGAPDETEIDRRFPRDFVDGLVEGAKFKLPQYLEKEQRDHSLLLFQADLKRMKRVAEPYAGYAWQNRRFSDRGWSQNYTVPFIEDTGVR